MKLAWVLVSMLAGAPSRLTVDTHVHVTMSRAAKPFFVGEPGRGIETWSTKPFAVNQLEADQLLRAGNRLVVASVWPPPRLRPGRSALDEALHQLAGLADFTRRESDFVLVGSVGEARRQLALGRVALVPAVEGGEGIESADDVDRLYAAGARSVTLVHFVSTQLGGAAAGQLSYNLFKVRAAEPTALGLTELGREAVTRMFELGMVVDLAHASDALSADVLQLAEAYGVPVMNSHSGARALLDLERSIPDALAARIARGGGMVGVTASKPQLGQRPDLWEGYAPGTCDDLVASWAHLMSVVPAEQLNLGTDLNGYIVRPSPGGSCPNGLRNAFDLPELYQALVARGVPQGALDGSGERFLGMWQAVEQRASPDAVARARAADVSAHSTFDVAL